MSSNNPQPNIPARKVVAYTAVDDANDNAAFILEGINAAFTIVVGEAMLLETPQAVIDRVTRDGDTVNRLYKVTIEEVGTTE